jgi:hypothetical protein
MRGAHSRHHQPRCDQRIDRAAKMRIEAGLVDQLQRVDREFEIDQPAIEQLRVERSSGRLVRRHLGAHRRSFGGDVALRAGAHQDALDHFRHRGAGLGRAEQRPGAGQRHMLPGPGAFLLIALEAVERDHQRPLRTRRTQPHVDLVERPRRGGGGERRSHPLRQPVVIGHGTERLRAIGFRHVIAGEQIDQVEIGSMGQRPSPIRPSARISNSLSGTRPCARTNSSTVASASVSIAASATRA